MSPARCFGQVPMIQTSLSKVKDKMERSPATYMLISFPFPSQSLRLGDILSSVMPRLGTAELGYWVKEGGGSLLSAEWAIWPVQVLMASLPFRR